MFFDYPNYMDTFLSVCGVFVVLHRFYCHTFHFDKPSRTAHGSLQVHFRYAGKTILEHLFHDCVVGHIAQIDEEMTESIDASYFFGEGAKQAKLNPVLYPDRSVVERCAMMHDSGDRTPKMLEMWARVKGDSVPLWIWAVIIVSFSAIAFLYIRRKIIVAHKKSHRAAKYTQRKCK